MNANKLDEWIDNSPYTEKEEVIRLLRQQQAEIERLETALKTALLILRKAQEQ